MKGKRIKEINNLTIYQDTAEKIRVFDVIKDNPSFGKCSVWTQAGKCLEDQMTMEQAEAFCEKTFDEVSTEALKKMAAEAFSKYYKLATVPCGNWQKGMEFPELEAATKRLNTINDELERRRGVENKSFDCLLSDAEEKSRNAEQKAETQDKGRQAELDL